MKNLQKSGGIAAIVEALTFLVAIVLVFVVVMPAGDVDPVAYMVDNQLVMYTLNVLVYVISSVAQIVVVLAVYERLKSGPPAVVQTATALGLIWSGVVLAYAMIASIGMEAVIALFGQDPAQANVIWRSVGIVMEGLGGGTELVGGLWFLLISLVALRIGAFPRVLNYLGLIVGAAGIITLIPVPVFRELSIVFGLGTIAWFIWAGTIMIRTGASKIATATDALALNRNN